MKPLCYDCVELISLEVVSGADGTASFLCLSFITCPFFPVAAPLLKLGLIIRIFKKLCHCRKKQTGYPHVLTLGYEAKVYLY